MKVDIPDAATGYIRHALQRDLADIRKSIETSKETLASEYTPASTKEVAQSNLDWFTEYYAEVAALYRELPEALRPDKDLLDYEVS